MLREKIEYLQKKIEKMDREIEPIKTKIVELTTEKNALETKIREVESHRKLIKDYSILVQSISREVLDARYKLLLLISMKKKEMTREEALAMLMDKYLMCAAPMRGRGGYF